MFFVCVMYKPQILNAAKEKSKVEFLEIKLSFEIGIRILCLFHFLSLPLWWYQTLQNSFSYLSFFFFSGMNEVPRIGYNFF